MKFSPSIYAHIVGGSILVISIIFLALYTPKIMSKDPYEILVLILLFSIATSIHGISHLGLESIYGYVPFYMHKTKRQA